MKFKLNAKTIVLFIATFIIFGCIGVSFVYYGPTKSYDISKDENPIQILDPNSANIYNDCNSTNDGIKITGEQPYIIFNNINRDIKSIKCEFTKLTTKDDSKYFNWKYNDSYTIDVCLNKFNSNANNYLCFMTKGRSLSEIKVNIFNDHFILKNIKLYDCELVPVDITMSTNPILYLIIFIIDLFICLMIIILNQKYCFLSKLAKSIKGNIKFPAKKLWIIISLLGITLVIEFCLSVIFFNMNSTNMYFNPARFFFIAATIVLIYLFIIILKNNNISVERIFLTIALTIGTVMILSAPFGHTAPDLDNHFRWVSGPSNINGYSTLAEQNVVWGWDKWFEDNLLDNQDKVDQLNNEDLYTTHNTSRQINIAHVPGTIIYSLGRLFKLPFIWKFNLVRFSYLILYSLICYFALKKLKSNKYLLSCIALFPANLFLASNITYDWWVTSLSIYGVAVFLSEQQQPNKTYLVKNTIKMCGCIFLACVVKMVYFPLLFLPLFLKKKDFNNKTTKRKHLVITLFIISLSLLSFIMTTLIASSSTGDIRGGSDVNSKNQILFIIENPIQYSQILINFLLNYLSLPTSIVYTSQMGYFGVASDFGIFIILMITSTIIDRNKSDKYTTNCLLKIVNIIIFIITVSMVATALYISFTPVAAETINGCQPRYIIPLLFPLLATIGTNKIINKMPHKYMNLLIFIPICVFNLLDVGSLMLSKMM